MARFMQKSYVEHLFVAKNILRYIVGTKNLVLKYPKLPLFFLLGFSNSDYGGDRDDRKSTSSYVVIISLGTISWSNYNRKP